MAKGFRCGSGFDKKKAMEELWKNASPDSDFPPQTVSFDLSEYEFCAAEIKEYGLYIWRVGERTNCSITNVWSAEGFGAHNYISRSFTSDNNGVTVNDCYSISTDLRTIQINNNACIPLVFYGIKGVNE